jgi:hypothetical protein
MHVLLCSGVLISSAVSCCTAWAGGGLGCDNRPANLYPLKGDVWSGGSFKEEVQVSSSNIKLYGINS